MSSIQHHLTEARTRRAGRRVDSCFLVVLLCVASACVPPSLQAQGAKVAETLRTIPFLIDEIRIDQPSGDNDEYFELSGPATASLNGWTYVVLGDSSGDSAGVIEAVVDLDGQSTGADGLFVAAEGTFSLGTADFTTTLNFENGDPVTHLLVTGFSGTLGQDLDTNNDGTLETTPWTGVGNCIGLVPDGPGHQVYCTDSIGPDGTFLPGHVFRCPEGFRIGAFNPSGGDDTPGSANTCPVTLSVDDLQINEGDAGTSTASFTVSLSSPAPAGGVTFNIATSDGSAQAPGDYLAASGVGESIAAGLSTFSFDVTINGDLDPEPDETFTVEVSNVSGAQEGDTIAEGTILNDDGNVVLSIGAIQGTAADGNSPVVGQMVRTEDNIVTALADDGFVMQSPALRSDGDPDSSDGIFVFTDTAPTVAVGDQVDVEGTVVEFFDATQIGNGPIVGVDASGLALPAPVVFDASTPSPNQPQSPIEYERFEYMRVQIAGGTVTGGNQSFGSDPVAEVHITAGPARTFRETGIEFPGLPDLPVWDGNPEVFELDPDRVGLANRTILAGATFDATGVLGFEFGGWELWPTELTITDEPAPAAVELTEVGEMTVGSLNLLFLFDDVDDPGPGDNGNVSSPADYQRRLEKLSLYIREQMGSPTVLAVQEAEHLQALQDLSARIASDDAAVVYTAFLVPGNNFLNLGYMVRELPANPGGVTVDGVTQLGASEIFAFDNSLLHDRPPLRLDVTTTGGYELAVLNLHQRSLNGIDDPADGDRVRNKRLAQAQSVAQMVQDEQDANPQSRLLVIGDYNAFEFTDGYVDVLGQIRGRVEPTDNLLSGPDLVSPDLWNLMESLPDEERYSFVFRGSGNVLDHALATCTLSSSVSGIDVARGNADAARDLENLAASPLRSSDHDGLVVYLQLGPEVIFGDAFECGNNDAWPLVVP